MTFIEYTGIVLFAAGVSLLHIKLSNDRIDRRIRKAALLLETAMDNLSCDGVIINKSKQYTGDYSLVIYVEDPIAKTFNLTDKVTISIKSNKSLFDQRKEISVPKKNFGGWW